MAKLAVNGGTPVRTQDFPAWPIYNEREKELLLETLESRKWGRIEADKNEKFEKLNDF